MLNNRAEQRMDQKLKTSYPLVEMCGVKKSFNTSRKEAILVLNRINLEIRVGEILGLIGPSGSGKTTIARILTGLEATETGKIFFDSKELTSLSLRKRRQFCREIQMIFQDPYSSMSSRKQIYNIVAEPLKIQKYPMPHLEKVCGGLLQVGIPQDFLWKYPFELSGGERQRIAIARALMLNPKFIIADEIVSMLDSSRKIEILDLLIKLRADMGLTVLFITHDIGVANYVCDRIAVMKDGRIIEIGETAKILKKPNCPETIALIEAVPTM